MSWNYLKKERNNDFCVAFYSKNKVPCKVQNVYAPMQYANLLNIYMRMHYWRKPTLQNKLDMNSCA